MTISHTPGPWRTCADEESSSGEMLYAVAASSSIVCAGAMQADAALVAAAPDLYAALRLASIALSQVPTSAGIDGLVQEALARARAALTLAEGR